MDQDLLDLLAGWRGGDGLDDTRRAELLARLRGDEAFRRVFVEEIRLLGMLKAVQSTDPRWLVLEDELGWSADERAAAIPLEERVLQHLQDRPRSRKFGRWQWGAAAAVVLLAAAALLFWPWGGRELPVPAQSTPPYVAVVVKLDGAQWEPASGPRPSEGTPLTAGPLRLHAGRVTLTLFNGVMLSLQGPADLDLLSVERLFCQQGKLRARVPPGAEGFVVLAPGSAVVDLGTEFGLNVGADGQAELMVFEGKAEVSVLNAEGHTLRSELLEGRKAVRVDPSAGRIREVAAAPDDFVAAPELIPPALVLDRAYPEAVRMSRPWGYWRFEAMRNRVIRNEVPGRPSLRAKGPVTLAGAPGENRCARFGRTPTEQYLVMDGSWKPPRQTGYAVELWVLPEEVNVGTLVNLISRADEPAQKHIFLLELTGRSHHLVHEPCTVRYLDRWPPAHGGGVNVFSRRMYVPYRWHHLVAQKVSDRLELYLDGDLAGTAQAEAEAPTTPCRLMVGRLKHGAQPGLDQIRPFVGRIDELAVYDHPLSPEEIRRHRELGSPAEKYGTRSLGGKNPASPS
jgi:hypothetical protein